MLTAEQVKIVSDIMRNSMSMVEKNSACAADYMRDLGYLHGQGLVLERYIRTCLDVPDGQPYDVYNLLKQQCKVTHALWRDKQRQLFQCLSTEDRANFLRMVGMVGMVDYDDDIQLHVMDDFARRLARVVTHFSGVIIQDQQSLNNRYVISSNDPTVTAFMQPLVSLMTAYINDGNMPHFIKKSRDYLQHAKPSRINQTSIALYQAVVTLLRLCFYSFDVGFAWVHGRPTMAETVNPLAMKWVGRAHFFPREVESARQLAVLNQLQTNVSRELRRMISDNNSHHSVSAVRASVN